MSAQKKVQQCASVAQKTHFWLSVCFHSRHLCEIKRCVAAAPVAQADFLQNDYKSIAAIVQPLDAFDRYAAFAKRWKNGDQFFFRYSVQFFSLAQRQLANHGFEIFDARQLFPKRRHFEKKNVLISF